MGVTPSRRRRKGMEDVIVIDADTWRRLGLEQQEKLAMIVDLEGRNNKLCELLDESKETIAEHEETMSAFSAEVRGFRKKVSELEAELLDVKDRLKWSDRRTSQVIDAFDNVSQAASYTSQVSRKMVQLMDDLDLEFVIKGKK